MTDLPQIIADIRKAMEKASPGHWHPGCITDETSSCNCRSICDERYAGGIATVHIDNGIPSIADGGNDCPPFDEAQANCAYIVACNPENMSVILQALESARVERERAEAAEAERDAAFAMSRCECGADEACRNLVSITARAEAAEAERDRLRVELQAILDSVEKSQWHLIGAEKMKRVLVAKSAILRLEQLLGTGAAVTAEPETSHDQ